jgi:glycosyltransferase involved in cell wall biosynthesis
MALDRTRSEYASIRHLPQQAARGLRVQASELVTTLIILTHEAIGERMAGPAIRAPELAKAVRPEVRSILASPFPVARDVGEVETRTYSFGDAASMDRATADADVILIQGFTLHKFPSIGGRDLPIIVDLYCPFQFENLERRRLVEPDPAFRQHAASVDHEVLAAQIARGDFFLCASERQRDLWIGALYALGRVSAAAYDADPAARALVAVVPFGVPADPPEPGPPAFKGVVQGIAASDRLIVWGGSVTDWQDPVTPIRAVADAIDEVPALRLVLPTGIPNPDLPPMRAIEHARREASALGLVGRHVFFTDWVPYDGRAGYLLEAEVGVSAHTESLETRYAWRTRILDYFWAALPIVCTRGDSLGELVEQRGFGIAVDPGDSRTMGRAFVRMLTDAAFAAGCRERLRAVRHQYHWRTVADPLREFCGAPTRTSSSAAPPPLPGWRTRVGQAAAALGWRRQR